MQKSFSLQYKNIAMYIFCWLMLNLLAELI